MDAPDRRPRSLASSLVFTLFLGFFVQPAIAQESEEEILAIIRSLAPTTIQNDQASPAIERRYLADAVAFSYDSAKLLPTALVQLDNVAAALNSSELAGYAFRIEGHTDARGERDYNRDLSQRRAAAVATYLVDTHGVSAERLEVSGYGEERLKTPDAPESSINRRVEIVTLVLVPSVEDDSDADVEAIFETDPLEHDSLEADGGRVDVEIEW
jgi:outer membrane protein OmpA-like peptidoglycan-associated protein